MLRGFRQFDALVRAIITYDHVLDGSDDAPFDRGAMATALVNAPGLAGWAPYGAKPLVIVAVRNIALDERQPRDA